MKGKMKDKRREDQDEREQKRDERKDDFVEKCLRNPNPPDELPQNVPKKIPVGRIIFQFFSLECSESDRVFNYLHDSNSIFRAAGINSEKVSVESVVSVVISGRLRWMVRKVFGKHFWDAPLVECHESEFMGCRVPLLSRLVLHSVHLSSIRMAQVTSLCAFDGLSRLLSAPRCIHMSSISA